MSYLHRERWWSPSRQMFMPTLPAAHLWSDHLAADTNCSSGITTGSFSSPSLLLLLFNLFFINKITLSDRTLWWIFWKSRPVCWDEENITVSEEKVTQSAALFWPVREVSVFTHRSVGWWPRPWPRRRCLRSSRTCTASSDALLSSPGPTPPRSTRTLSAPLHQSCRHRTLWWVLHTLLTNLHFKHLSVCFTFMCSRDVVLMSSCSDLDHQRSVKTQRRTKKSPVVKNWTSDEEMKEPACSSSVGSVRRCFMFPLLLHVYLTRLWSSLEHNRTQFVFPACVQL